MPSNSLQYWQSTRESRLDEIEHAHVQVGGTARGRRFATRQINYAYTMLLSSEFQGYCRDLHSESLDHLMQITAPVSLRAVLRVQFTIHRKLDRGNPTPTNLGADFNRFGLAFLDEVRALGSRNITRLNHLEQLNRWRNAIAHNDFDPRRLGGTMSLHKSDVQQWRSSCRQLAISFDRVMKEYFLQITGNQPW